MSIKYPFKNLTSKITRNYSFNQFLIFTNLIKQKFFTITESYGINITKKYEIEIIDFISESFNIDVSSLFEIRFRILNFSKSKYKYIFSFQIKKSNFILVLQKTPKLMSSREFIFNHHLLYKSINIPCFVSPIFQKKSKENVVLSIYKHFESIVDLDESKAEAIIKKIHSLSETIISDELITLTQLDNNLIYNAFKSTKYYKRQLVRIKQYLKTKEFFRALTSFNLYTKLYKEELLQTINKQQFIFAHADLTINNILWNRRLDVPVFIDFESVSLMPPNYDLIYFFALNLPISSFVEYVNNNILQFTHYSIILYIYNVIFSNKKNSIDEDEIIKLLFIIQ